MPAFLEIVHYILIMYYKCICLSNPSFILSSYFVVKLDLNNWQWHFPHSGRQSMTAHLSAIPVAHRTEPPFRWHFKFFDVVFSAFYLFYYYIVQENSFLFLF